MSSEVYYIVFTEAKRPKWYMKCLKKGFSHCYVIQPYFDKWIKYEYGHGKARADILDDVHGLINECIIVKHVRKDIDIRFSYCSCVGFVKAIAGIKSRAVTPYQLFKGLSNVS